MWFQKQISLPSHKRGFHIITHFIEKSIKDIKKIDIGLLHVFIHHTSASLTVNEDADPSVRQDFETHFNELIPENNPKLIHTSEGPDDMPAHLKSAILGSSLTIPYKTVNSL
jgi:secondary thiamine-phosphate synthase enzyme